MRDLYGEVSTRIITELERGAAPWVKPWAATAGHNVPQNAVTNRPYSGCNVILLWLARKRSGKWQKTEVSRAGDQPNQFVSRAGNFAWPLPNSFHRTAVG